jgi:hypothetical protein
MGNEKIVCAAIWYQEIETFPHGNDCRNIDKGIVVCGWRHGGCIGIMKGLTNKRTVTVAEDGVGKHIQGFLTTHNRFVDRYEAFEIAEREGQILDMSQTRGKRLFSEDLY